MAKCCHKSWTSVVTRAKSAIAKAVAAKLSLLDPSFHGYVTRSEINRAKFFGIGKPIARYCTIVLDGVAGYVKTAEVSICSVEGDILRTSIPSRDI